MNLVRKVKAYFKLSFRKILFKEARVNSWYQYHRKNDILVNRYADTIHEFYKLYPYTVIFTARTIINKFDNCDNCDIALDNLKNWCILNCKHFWRTDIHRVMEVERVDYKDMLVSKQWLINDFGAEDIVVFAFVSDKDYMWFNLKFS